MSFVFIRDSHEYYLDGERIFSNTELLEAEGFSDYSSLPSDIRDAALARGSLVHEATLLYDQGRPIPLAPGLIGYLDAWITFRKAFEFKPLLREQPLCDPELRCATCPDAWGESNRGLITVQIKTGKVQPFVGLQTAFEERVIALNSTGKIRKAINPNINNSTSRRFGIELKPDGDFTPTQFTEKTDIRIWLAAFTIQSWKQKYLRRKKSGPNF